MISYNSLYSIIPLKNICWRFVMDKAQIQHRPSWDEMFLSVARECASRSTCLRRKYGSVIVDADHRIISTGYNGSPRGCGNCTDIGYCVRKELNIPSGERYELCQSVHSEMNACLNASPELCKGATLYLYGMDGETGEPLPSSECCLMCKRVIINMMIDRVVSYKDGEIVSVWRYDLIRQISESHLNSIRDIFFKRHVTRNSDTHE